MIDEDAFRLAGAGGEEILERARPFMSAPPVGVAHIDASVGDAIKPGSGTVRDLARVLGLDVASVGRSIARLVQAGTVEALPVVEGQPRAYAWVAFPFALPADAVLVRRGVSFEIVMQDFVVYARDGMLDDDGVTGIRLGRAPKDIAFITLKYDVTIDGDRLVARCTRAGFDALVAAAREGFDLALREAAG